MNENTVAAKNDKPYQKRIASLLVRGGEEAVAEHRALLAEKSRLYRMQMSEEQKQQQRVNARRRQAEHRQKKEEEVLPTRMTRAEKEKEEIKNQERREYWKICNVYRENRTRRKKGKKLKAQNSINQLTL